MGKGIKPKELTGLPDELRYLAHIAGSENPGYIYLLVAETLGLVKIGASNRWEGIKVAVDKRIREIINDVPLIPITNSLVIVAASLGRTETEIHRHFAHYRVAGEWFIYADDLKGFVESVARFLKQVEEWSKPGAPDPTEFPWKLLDSPAKPPLKKFVDLQSRFESV
jgi:hypothetical protein